MDARKTRRVNPVRQANPESLFPQGVNIENFEIEENDQRHRPTLLEFICALSIHIIVFIFCVFILFDGIFQNIPIHKYVRPLFYVVAVLCFVASLSQISCGFIQKKVKFLKIFWVLVYAIIFSIFYLINKKYIGKEKI